MSQKNKIDTRSLGLDIASNLVRFVTGHENLHYGYWPEDLKVCAANLGQAQEIYTSKVQECFPKKALKILDIGGGCGEFAKKLSLQGHEVEIVVPSQVLADRCRVNVGPKIPIYNSRFEDISDKPSFDLCLFSESLQYIPLDIALDKAKANLAHDGEIVISDCFRTDEFYKDLGEFGIVGGGHSLTEFEKAVVAGEFTILSEEDITKFVAPSVDLEQNLYNMIGKSLLRIDSEMKAVHPIKWKILRRALKLFASERRLLRLHHRLFHDHRNSEQFCKYNQYKIIKIKP